MNSPRIILLAHGSSDKRWCETFEKLAAPTLASVDNARVAYMELAEPSIDTVCRRRCCGRSHRIYHHPPVPCCWATLAQGRSRDD